MKNMTPTLLARASRCIHSWHLECFGDPELKAEADAGTILIWERGLAHERRMVESLPGYSEPQWDGKDWAAGFEATLQLMRAGVEWIYQGVLIRDDMYGKPDLLERIEGPSRLGAHSYRPVDVKGHKDVVKKDRMQLASYANLLEPILGSRPEDGAIWLNTGETKAVDLTGPNAEFDALLKRMAALRAGRETSTGFRCSECGLCPWSEHCREEWELRHCICLVRSVTGDTARRLAEKGLRTWEQLADVSEQQLVDEYGLSESHAHAVHPHAKARVIGQVITMKEPAFPEGRPIIYYDIETYGDTVYLHGLICRDGDRREERSFLARHPEEERSAWHDFLDYLAGCRDAVVYTWTNYERGYVDGLWAKYGGNELGWRVLDSGMVDMCKFVKDHFALPVATYSIKEVAPVFGFHWQAEDAGGLNSEAWYGEWLEAGDEGIIEKIVQYNLDDVRAMEVIKSCLRLD